MKTIRNSIVTMLCIVCLLFSACVIMGFTTTPANASTSNNFTAEDYTSNDRLLKEDGTLSTKNITDFSNEVKSASVGTSFPELAQVIPLEYLESSQTEDTFQYNGKEYGFYVAKEGNYFDVLLIDFVYEFDDGIEHSDLEYKIRIKPILQQTFLRGEDANGNYIWTKSAGDYNYYVANPRFVSVVQNENSLNYGDNGYDKEVDDGVIIQQFRVNYGKINYATEEDLNEILVEFAVNTALNIGYDIMDMISSGTGTILGYINDLVELENDIYEAGKETTVLADNENNIGTNFSKEEQRTNSRFDGYSCLAGFSPQEEIILSDTDDSYMEMIVVLNDADYRSRLTQFCEFDIVRRSGNFSSMEYVAGNLSGGNAPSLNFSKQRVLFEDQEPQYTFEEEVYKSLDAVPVYLLPKGSQTIHFEPRYSANYKFSLPAGTQLTVEDATASAGNEYYLKGGVSYEIILTNNSETQRVISQIGCDLMDELIFGSNNVTIAGKTEHVFGLTADASGYYRLTVNNDVISVDCDATEMLDGTCYIYLEEDETVYPVLSNDSGQDISCRVTISDPLEIDLGDELYLTSYSGIYKFTNPYDATVDFQMILTLINGDSSATVYSDDGSTLGYFISGEDSRTNYFTLSEDESCYIIFEVEGEASVITQPYISQLRWEIDGEYMSNDIVLPRGKSYSVRLILLKNGEEVFNYTDIIGYETDSIKFDNSKGELNLLYDDEEPGDHITLWSLSCPDFPLQVTTAEGREEIDYTVTLDMMGGTGGTSSVEANFNREMPDDDLIAPRRPGYIFMGYFSEPNGNGTQYYDGEMQSTAMWEKEEDATIYACWEAETFLVTFDQNGGTGGTTSKDATVGEEMPSITLPSRTGYIFSGYYDKVGKCYYTSSSSSVIFDKDSDATLTARWVPIQWTVIFQTYIGTNEFERGEYLEMTYDQPHPVYGTTITAPDIEGYTFVEWRSYYAYYQINDENSYTKYTDQTVTIYNVLPVYGTNRFLTAVYTAGCVAEGTLITLSDGSQKPVELLTGNEMLLVWNMYTGTFDIAPILFIDSDPQRMYEVIRLSFSDGTTVDVISEHGFFDVDLNKYVYLDKNAAEYIGHSFLKQGASGMVEVILENVTITQEITTAYSPVTYGHLCYYVNGMLSMPGGIDGLFNIFEVDEETMTYDAEAMAADIEEYGLYTYEELNALVPVPEVMFNAVDGQYLKVAVGKGMITIEQIAELIERYSDLF